MTRVRGFQSDRGSAFFLSFFVIRNHRPLALPALTIFLDLKIPIYFASFWVHIREMFGSPHTNFQPILLGGKWAFLQKVFLPLKTRSPDPAKKVLKLTLENMGLRGHPIEKWLVLPLLEWVRLQFFLCDLKKAGRRNVERVSSFWGARLSSFSRVFMAEPVIFSLLGGTSSILRTFRAEPVKKTTLYILLTVKGRHVHTNSNGH